MAVRSVTLTEAGTGVMVAEWADLDNGDSGTPVALAGYPIKTIQVIGGTSADIEGSNDGGTTWAAVRELGGSGGTAALTAMTPSIKSIRENPLLIRPAGVVGANCKVVLVAVR
jgi:hypothetical protein